MAVYSCAVCDYTFSLPQPLKLALIIHVSVWWGGEVKAYLSNPLSQDRAMKNYSLTTLPFKAFSMEHHKGITLGNEYKTTKMTAVTSSYVSLSYLLVLYRFSCPERRQKDRRRTTGLASGLKLWWFLAIFKSVLCHISVRATL